VPLPFNSPVTVVERLIDGVVVGFVTVPANPLAEVTETLVTVPEPPPPPLYCGIFRVLPINVAAPLVPVVVSVMGD
jgi:hypothetical protein